MFRRRKVSSDAAAYRVLGGARNEKPGSATWTSCDGRRSRSLPTGFLSSSSDSGGAQPPPRRLRICTSSRLRPALSWMRSAAGEAWAALRVGPNITPQALALFGRELQAAQRSFRAGAGPGDHGGTGAGAQTALGGPQALAVRPGAHDDQPRKVHAQRLETRGIGQMRRRHQRQPLVFAGQMRQRRREQTQLADALLVDEQLGQRRPRPAATGKLRIQLGKARGNACDRDLGVLVAAPDGRVLEDEAELTSLSPRGRGSG